MSERHQGWAYTLPLSLLILAPFDLLASLAMDIYLPVVPAMPNHLGTTPEIIQLTLTLYLLGLGLGQIAFGPLSDRIGRRPVLLGGGTVFAAASAVLALTDSAAVFVAFRLVQALGASAALVATFATVRDVYADRPESATIYGTLSSLLAFVPALAPILGALIAHFGTWRAIFWALALVAVPPLLHAIARWEETRPVTDAQARSAWPILKSASFWFYTAAFGTAMGTFFVFFSTAPRILIGEAGYTPLEFSLAFASVALVMVATARLSGRFSTRWGIDGSITRGMILILVGAATLAIASISSPPSFATIILPAWILAVGIVFTVSVTPNGAMAEFGDRAGLAVALYFAGHSVIVAILGTGAVIAFNGDTAGPLIAFAGAMSTTILILQRVKKAL